MKKQTNKILKLLTKQGVKNEKLDGMAIDLYTGTCFHRWTIDTTPENPDLFSNIMKIFKDIRFGDEVVRVKYIKECDFAFGPWIRIYCKSYEKRMEKENQHGNN